MGNERLKDLLFGYTKGTLSAEELAELLSYVKLDNYEDIIYQSMEEDWNREEIYILASDVERELVYKKAVRDLTFSPKAQKNPIHRIRLFTLRNIAATAAVLVLSLSIYILARNLSGNSYDNDVAPGGAKAQLTLADGRVITLDSGVNALLANQSGIRISKSVQGQLVYTVVGGKESANDSISYNTLKTPPGGQYQLILSDGTKVWLNASSSIKYPASFAKLKERKVQLNGEAYFEVAHNKAMPFKVFSDRQEIEVLGTHFNVNCYNDEPVTKTTLLEGSVRINTEANRIVVLRPGQQAMVNDQIRVEDVDLELAVAWKNGDFILKDEDFKTSMRKIARWYNVDVIYDASAPDDLELGGWVSRSKNISTVLHLMESTGKVHFKVQGRRVTVTK
jgi:ferric-dicitrate binding protein FerR (iron transport regulator)